MDSPFDILLRRFPAGKGSADGRFWVKSSGPNAQCSVFLLSTVCSVGVSCRMPATIISLNYDHQNIIIMCLSHPDREQTYICSSRLVCLFHNKLGSPPRLFSFNEVVQSVSWYYELSELRVAVSPFYRNYVLAVDVKGSRWDS